MDKDMLQKKITEMVQNAPENSYQDKYRIYDEPLVGFAAANDPIFTDYKKPEIIGDIFRTPLEWYGDAVTVISFFLPFSEPVRRSNVEKGPASDEWMHGRFVGEEFANHVRRFIIKELENAGGEALAPHIEPEFNADFTIFASNWSERHIAYAAGLGTFSLNRGLITEKGMAGRFGSVVTNLHFEPTPRKYPDPFHNCPHTREGKCGACIKRCPVGAITKDGKDKAPCHHYLFITNPRKEFADQHGYPYSACGKCQTKVPCETQIP
ncbi:epoxyqueuosine reductase [Dethiobacter alkaliphilus]|uniref:4Fe-4S ferredoxin, iron-sulfur binding protein n=1 Tax=Dethiobacter alkaliphilus AHT 1 TaxID=555088 RepID=C0GHI7_DETAL|nr:epoxyqueuosine reductase [Dethiobacter alkaliphilus]EEG77193.1 4Fe-4S ferredoxin, iron-sulfur binding protein [Dethiobacter alkaliphilus AHT 1]